MEKNKGASSHFVGIIRVVVLAIVLFLLVFLFTRWAINRRQQGTETSKTTTSKTTDTKTSDKDTPKSSTTEAEDESATSKTDGADSAGSQEDSAPNIDHIPATTPEPSGQQPTNNVPNTGAESTALSIISIAAIVYIVGLNRTITKKRAPSL